MSRNKVLTEGMVAGIIGASTVAVWFFVVDLVRGEPLHTPKLLGTAALSIFGVQVGDAVLWPVAGYTLIHYVAFTLVGIFAAIVVEASNKSPSLLAGLFLLFAVFEVGFYSLCVVLSMLSVLGDLAWYQVGVANLVASFTMGWFLWHRHPEAVPRLNEALRGTT